MIDKQKVLDSIPSDKFVTFDNVYLKLKEYAVFPLLKALYELAKDSKIEEIHIKNSLYLNNNLIFRKL